jgi:hypothetical protein
MRRPFLTAFASFLLLVSLPSAALAGWHFSRGFSISAGSGQATGHTCTSSKFANWTWHGTVHSHGNTVHITWLEPIRSDGRKHSITYLNVSSPQIDALPPNEGAAVKSAVLHAAQRQHPQVRWVNNSGTQYLDYFLNGHLSQVVEWHPQHGC